MSRKQKLDYSTFLLPSHRQGSLLSHGGYVSKPWVICKPCHPRPPPPPFLSSPTAPAHQNSFSFLKPAYASLPAGLQTILFWVPCPPYPGSLFLILSFLHFHTMADPGFIDSISFLPGTQLHFLPQPLIRGRLWHQ